MKVRLIFGCGFFIDKDINVANTLEMRLILGCVLVVSVIEQLAQWHNSTVKAAVERLCDYIPVISIHMWRYRKMPLQHKLAWAQQKNYLTTISKNLLSRTGGTECCNKKSKKNYEDFQGPGSHQYINTMGFGFVFYSVLRNKLPFEDFDGDKFSTFPTLRGYHWRGRDCNDKNTTVYPGRRPHNWDAESDYNCNGIWGVDPKDGIPYEEKFCKATLNFLPFKNSLAYVCLALAMALAAPCFKKSFANLPMAFSDELDWPQFSEITGFLNSTIGLARNQLLDNPAIVIYATIGNDVCNRERDTLAHMTTPKEMLSNVMQALRYLDSHLPNGSHVILTGLVDGRFLWDNLHDRYHPLGQLNKDVTYSQLYSFLDCLQVSPCSGWLTPNETLRNLTSVLPKFMLKECDLPKTKLFGFMFFKKKIRLIRKERILKQRALQLSNVLKEIARSEKFVNFDIFYMDFPLRQTAEEWRKMGGEPWQLIEPVDGFHPSQIAAALGTGITWQRALHEWPQVLGKENPFNDQIEAIFKDQGGH
ncbi:Acyloxyacyl hydrolase [Turdus rufiventris]|nr:Acyloxyacyl hydrolase [Turdus rufiventris]